MDPGTIMAMPIRQIWTLIELAHEHEAERRAAGG